MLAMLAACGGGGGGTAAPASPPPAPAPPPPAGNSAPQPVVTVNYPIVDEGRSFVIDASASTDSDGDALTFDIEQVSGITLPQESAAGGVFTYSTPMVGQDELVSFKVTVRDNETASETTVDITVRNYARAPLSTQWGGELFREALPTGAVRAFAHDDDNSAPSLNNRLYIVSEDEDGLVLHRETPAVDGSLHFSQPLLTFAPDESSVPAIFEFFDYNLDTQLDMAVLSPSDSGVETYLVQEDGAGGFTMIDSGGATVSGACALTSAYVGEDRPTAGVNEFPGVLIGTHGNGLTALLNDGNPRDAGYFSRTLTVSTAGRACGLSAPLDLDGEGGYEVYAYDPARQEFTGFNEPVTTSTVSSLTFNASLPASDMKLVEVASGIGAAGQQLLAALFSDGVHEGHHAVLIFQNSGGSIQQTTINLPNGVPTDMVFATIDSEDPAYPSYSDYDSDLVIAVPGTPYIYVLENLSSPVSPGLVTFSDIAYVDVGFGVQTVDVLEATDDMSPDLITGSDAGIVVIHKNAD